MLCAELEDVSVEKQDDDEVPARERGAVGVVTIVSGEAIEVDYIADVVTNNSGEAILEEVNAHADLDIEDKELN